MNVLEQVNKTLKWSKSDKTIQFSTSVELRLLLFSVCVCVCQREIWRTALRILPKLGQKLEGDEWGTVTEPVFPEKFFRP